MTADGNLISKGQGEGEAIMIQPFLPDQTPFNQMNKALMQQSAQKAQIGMANQKEAEGSRDAWLKRLSNANYNRLDEPAIRKLQDKIIESITSYKTGEPKTNIEQQIAAFEYLTKTSQESLKGDNEIQSDMIKNADKVWYKGQDEWTKAQVENTAETYEDAIKAIARRDAARKSVVQGGEKINEPIPYLDKIVQKASMTSNEPVQYKGADGTLITKYETFTDPKKLRETVEFDFKNNPEAQRVFGSAEEMYNQADKRAVYKKSVNSKFIPSSSSTSGISGEKNKKLNFTYTYGKNGDIVGVDPQTVGGTATKEYATTEINGKPQKVRVEDTKNGKVTVFLPENEAIMKSYQKKRAEWGDRIKKKSAEFNAKYKDKTDADKELALWAKSDKEPISPNLPTTMELEGEQAERVWHQAYGVTLDQAYTGNVPAFVREDKSLKGNGVGTKTTKSEIVEIKVGDKRNGKKITNVGRNKQGVVVKVQYSDGTIEDL